MFCDLDRGRLEENDAPKESGYYVPCAGFLVPAVQRLWCVSKFVTKPWPFSLPRRHVFHVSEGKGEIAMWWKNIKQRSTRKLQTAKREPLDGANSCALSIEVLEERHMLSVVAVSNLTDGKVVKAGVPSGSSQAAVVGASVTSGPSGAMAGSAAVSPSYATIPTYVGLYNPTTAVFYLKNGDSLEMPILLSHTVRATTAGSPLPAIGPIMVRIRSASTIRRRRSST